MGIRHLVIISAVFLLSFQSMVRSSYADQKEPSPFHVVSAKTEMGDVRWQVELASDNESRATGLMFRKSMPKSVGMLFRFEETRAISMWMKNTFISLDMIFLSESGVVTHIHKSAEPQSLAIINSEGPARYVLEINAGEAISSALKVGTQFRHPWFLSVE